MPFVERASVSKGRLEAFSDGVFAIAITLLVIEVKVPHVDEGGSLVRSLLDQWPQYVGYAISFSIIGIIWVNHHHVMGEVIQVTRKLTFLNLGLLSAVAFLPFPTALLAEYVLVVGSRSHAAAVVYSGTMLLIATWFFFFWVYIVRAGLYDPRIDAPGLRRRVQRAAIAPAGYVLTVVLALLSAPLALAAHGAIAILYAFDTATGPDQDLPGAAHSQS